MTDDVFFPRMLFMVPGKARPQAVKPHQDLLAEFLFLGLPHPRRHGLLDPPVDAFCRLVRDFPPSRP